MQVQEGVSNLVVLKNERAKFAIGAKIRLKSGGPTMTVSAGTPTMVEAVWFEGKHLMRALFHNAMVRKINA